MKTATSSWQSWPAQKAAQQNAEADIETFEHFTCVTFYAPGTPADADKLTQHLETRLAQGESFCLLFHSLSGLEWEAEAQRRFNVWWSANKTRLGCCQAFATVCILSWRSRLLSELVLSKELDIPCRCFRHISEARAWAQAYAKRTQPNRKMTEEVVK